MSDSLLILFTVSGNQYFDEKYFLKSWASEFVITANRVRGSVVAFSSFTLLSIKFNEHYQTCLHKTTEQELAFRKFLYYLLVDHKQRDAEYPALIAKELRKSGAHMVVIGIGNKVDYTELNSIADDSNRGFTAASFQ